MNKTPNEPSTKELTRVLVQVRYHADSFITYAPILSSIYYLYYYLSFLFLPFSSMSYDELLYV